MNKYEIEKLKKIYIHLLRSIKRENTDIEGLIKYLLSSDFFVAPCSSAHHLACDGGLLKHSLNVYTNLCILNRIKGAEIPDDSIKIVALCHDFAKIRYYEPYMQNKKVYSDIGSNSDSLGRFDWVPTKSYKKSEDRLCIGSHGETSEYITRTFIPLTL